jgi:hypothetical protein
VSATRHTAKAGGKFPAHVKKGREFDPVLFSFDSEALSHVVEKCEDKVCVSAMWCVKKHTTNAAPHGSRSFSRIFICLEQNLKIMSHSPIEITNTSDIFA